MCPESPLPGLFLWMLGVSIGGKRSVRDQKWKPHRQQLGGGVSWTLNSCPSSRSEKAFIALQSQVSIQKEDGRCFSIMESHSVLFVLITSQGWLGRVRGWPSALCTCMIQNITNFPCKSPFSPHPTSTNFDSLSSPYEISKARISPKMRRAKKTLWKWAVLNSLIVPTGRQRSRGRESPFRRPVHGFWCNWD